MKDNPVSHYKHDITVYSGTMLMITQFGGWVAVCVCVCVFSLFLSTTGQPDSGYITVLRYLTEADHTREHYSNTGVN